VSNPWYRKATTGQGEFVLKDSATPLVSDGSTPFGNYMIQVCLWLATTTVKGNHKRPLVLKWVTGTLIETIKRLAKDTMWLKDMNNAEPPPHGDQCAWK